MQDTWMTAGLVALVVVLLAVLWMRRHPRGDAPATIENKILGMVAADIQLVEALRQKGVDLNAPRHIDLEFHAPSEDAAHRLVAALVRTLPGEADVRPAVKPRTWAVTYVVQTTISSIVQADAVERRIRLAAAVGGEHDGWGTPLGP